MCQKVEENGKSKATCQLVQIAVNTSIAPVSVLGRNRAVVRLGHHFGHMAVEDVAGTDVPVEGGVQGGSLVVGGVDEGQVVAKATKPSAHIPVQIHVRLLRVRRVHVVELLLVEHARHRRLHLGRVVVRLWPEVDMRGHVRTRDTFQQALGLGRVVLLVEVVSVGLDGCGTVVRDDSGGIALRWGQQVGW